MPAVRFRFDHAVVVVDTLARASSRFATAGFTVTPGGRHDALPTENALVAFADGSYLELIALRDADGRAGLRALRDSPGWEAHLKSASAIARRFLPRLAGDDGVGDACIAGERIARFAAEARQRELALAGPVRMRRERSGAGALDWDLLLPAEDIVPFVIEDRTPREWRVPGGAATLHANGATGIAEAFVRADGVAAGALRLSGLFDAPLSAPGGRSCADFAGVRWWLEEGLPAGACAVGIAGVSEIAADVAALGVRPAGGSAG